MRPIFTVHAGEYLVASHIEQAHKSWSVWVPSKDTGIDLLVTDARNDRTASLQVKFSKDFNPTHQPPLVQSKLLSAGWWTHDLEKIRKSKADFWVFVLPSFLEKKTSFVILTPKQLLQRLTAIHGKPSKKLHSYFWITKSRRCWEARGLPNADQELLALDRFSDTKRDFTAFLNGWKQIAAKLK